MIRIFLNILKKSIIILSYALQKSNINSYNIVNSLIKRATIADFKYKDEISNVLQSIGLDANLILTNVSEQCLTSIENTYDCFNSVNSLLVSSNTNPQKFDEICNIYESQTCDYFRNTVITGNSGCTNNFDKEYFSLNFDTSIFYYVGTCTKNSKNEYCPAVSYYRSILSKDIEKTTDENKIDIINQSCSDIKCIDQMKKIVAVTPSVTKVFDLMFPLSGETEESLNQIKTALDITPMQEPLNNCNQNKEITISYAFSVKTISIAITIFLMLTTLLIIL
eukprot:jgi/Orpsp1_1/1174074/evm.model.c7180000048828.2